MSTKGQEWRPPFPLDDELLRRAEDWVENNHEGRGEPEIPKATIIFLPFTRGVAMVPGCLVPNPILIRMKNLLGEEFEGRAQYAMKEMDRDLNNEELQRIIEILRARLRSTMEELQGRHLLLDLTETEKVDVTMAMDIFQVVEVAFMGLEKCKECPKGFGNFKKGDELPPPCPKVAPKLLGTIAQLAQVFSKNLERLCIRDDSIFTPLILDEAAPLINKVLDASVSSMLMEAFSGIMEKLQESELTDFAKDAVDKGCVN